MTAHAPIPAAKPPLGVRIAGCGTALPEKLVTNEDLVSIMDTSDEWIRKRTGIEQRHIYDPDSESTADFAIKASQKALDKAGVSAEDIDLVVCATMTPDMPTPSVACVTAAKLGCRDIPALDLNAACSGFVYSLNFIHEMMRGGQFKNAIVIGVDTITRFLRFDTFGRATSVLFGDGAGAFVLSTTEDNTVGMCAHRMHSDGNGGKDLYIPCHERDFVEGADTDERNVGIVQMNGQAVFRFAVSRFPQLIQETLDAAGLTAEDVDHFVCHQSNSRILGAARERFGLPESKLRVNIHRMGNTVGASVPLVFADLDAEGLIKPGQRVMFLGFGAGLTWASSLWQV